MKILLLNCLAVFLLALGCPSEEGKEQKPDRILKKITYSAVTDQGKLIEFEMQIEDTYRLTDDAGKITSGTLKPESKFGGFYETTEDKAQVIRHDELLVVNSKDMFAVGFPKQSSQHEVNEIEGFYNYLLLDKKNQWQDGVVEINVDHTWRQWEGEEDNGPEDIKGTWQDVSGTIELKTAGNNDYAKLLINPKNNLFVAALFDDEEFMFGMQKKTVVEGELDGQYVAVTQLGRPLALWKVEEDLLEEGEGYTAGIKFNEPWEGFLEEDQADWRAIASPMGIWFMVDLETNYDKNTLIVMVKK